MVQAVFLFSSLMRQTLLGRVLVEESGGIDSKGSTACSHIFILFARFRNQRLRLAKTCVEVACSSAKASANPRRQCSQWNAG